MIQLQKLDPLYWVKARCSTLPQQVYLTWQGSIYAWQPEAPRQHLFDMVGMNVGRCLPTESGTWDFTSRELAYYLDPQTGERLHHWQNPWTGETVKVLPVANDPVQGRFAQPFSAQVGDEVATFVIDLFLNYPNPLAAEPKFAPYSPQPVYQAIELFKLSVSAAELWRPEVTEVSQLLLSWDRIGPWLPWMKMGDRPGHLIYSAQGQKVPDFEALPTLLRSQIATQMPSFRHAPTHKLPQASMTSWLYFKAHFDDYLEALEALPLSA